MHKLENLHTVRNNELLFSKLFFSDHGCTIVVHHRQPSDTDYSFTCILLIFSLFQLVLHLQAYQQVSLSN